MRLPRVNSAHGTLAFIELAAVPVAILVTFLVLLLAAGVATVARSAGELLAIGGTAIEAIVGAVAVVTALVLLSAGGLAVVGYRDFVDRSFSTKKPILLLVVPAVGVVAPIAYGVVVLGTISFPLFAIAVISAHALAFRTISIDSLLRARRRIGVLVGVLTGAPAVAALTVFVTDHLLDLGGAGENEIAELLIGAMSGVGVPRQRWVLVAVPLLVTTAYVVQWTRTDTGGWSTPGWVPSKLVGWITSPPTGWIPDWSLRSVIERDRERSAKSSRGTAPSRPPRGGRRAPPPGSASRSGNKSSSGGSSAGRKSGSSAGGSSGSSGRRSGSASGGAAASASSRAGASGSTGDADDEGSGSDTRIFTDDFGQYAGDGTPVERCPDCEEEIPSDGVYKFCPFCGHEL